MNVIRILLDQGVDVHEEDNHHNNALHWSVRLGFDKISDILIAYDEKQRPSRVSRSKTRPAYSTKSKKTRSDGKDEQKIDTQNQAQTKSDPVILPSLGRPRIFLESASRQNDAQLNAIEDKKETRAQSDPLKSETSQEHTQQKLTSKKQASMDTPDEDPEPETGLIHLRNFDAGLKRSAGRMAAISPRSLEAMKRLGISVEDLMPPVRRLSVSESDDAEVQQKRKEMLEERRKRNVEACIKERKRLKARSKDATLNVIFAEYAGISGDNTMNMSEYLDMMRSMELLQTEDGRKNGKISKTEAVTIFKQFARKIGVTYEVACLETPILAAHLRTR
eukprot:768637-Hanusia_phi.AAC.7